MKYIMAILMVGILIKLSASIKMSNRSFGGKKFSGYKDGKCVAKSKFRLQEMSYKY